MYILLNFLVFSDPDHAASVWLHFKIDAQQDTLFLCGKDIHLL
jgi:hypothetical protein